MMRCLVLIAAALLVATPAAAQAGWWRGRGWEIDREDIGCTLHRAEAATDTGRIALRNGRDGIRTLTVSGQRWRIAEGGSHRLRLIPADNSTVETPPIEAEGTGFRGEPRWAGVHLTLTAEQQAALFRHRLLRVEEVTRHGRRRLGQVPGLLEGAAAPLGRCVIELGLAFRGTGLPAVSPPSLRGRIASLMALDDYPAAAIRAQEEGRVDMRLTVSARGLISNCQIVRSSGSTILDEASCGLLRRRARFFPALDADGQPTEGTYEQGIDWSLPPQWRN